MTQELRMTLQNEMLIEYFVAGDILRLELTPLGKIEIEDLDAWDLRTWVLNESHVLVCANELGTDFVVDDMGSLFELTDEDIKEMIENGFTEINRFNDLKGYLDYQDEAHVNFFKWFNEISEFPKTTIKEFNTIFDLDIQNDWSLDAVEKVLPLAEDNYIIQPTLNEAIAELIRFKVDLISANFYKICKGGYYVVIYYK